MLVMEENEEPVCGTIEDRKEIQTFIFLDIEGTGLKYDRPKIMEISLVAVSREDLLASSREYLKNLNKNSKPNDLNKNSQPNESGPSVIEKKESRVPALPRVLHKYTRLYYPRRFILPHIEEITNLNNCTLEHIPPFAEDSADALNLFVNLRKPVAFVAHNGHKYDFPILKAEFIQADRSGACSSVLCVDSYPAFVSLDGENEELKELSNMVIDNTAFENPSKRRKSNELPSEDQTDNTRDTMASPSSYHTPEKPSTKEILELAAKTPVKKRRLPSLVNTPSPGNKNNNVLVNTGSSYPRRKLEYNHSDSQSKISNNTPSKNSKRISYRQVDIYERLFNSNYRAHSAEGDSMALLQICCYYGNRFTDWADVHAIPFETVEPMWVKKL